MSERQVIVVGAGAAGLMAAGQSSATGAETVLLEKMDRPGVKLRITGQGRCNLTNVDPVREAIRHFAAGGHFVRPALYRFPNEALRAFFDGLGVPTKVERGGRVFPESEDARDVVDALVRWIDEEGVTLRTESAVEALVMEGGRVTGVRVADGRIYRGDAVIVATGGASYPATGSSGDGYRLAASVGHGIVPIRPALVPLETAGEVAPRLEGLSLRNVNVSVWTDGTKETETFGEMVFTGFGVSGPIILTLSRGVVDALRAGRGVTLAMDLKPALDHPTLDARLLREIEASPKRHAQNMLKELLPSKLVPVCADLVGIPAHKPAHEITAEERKRLRVWLKEFRLEVTGHRPLREAIVTAGGVDTAEVDPQTMASRVVEGLYFAGEVVDVDAETGGYNLQAAFSMGWVAGRAAAGSRR
ncbi:MAG: NAD(P)/FAD-dependent oxidoreductase [Chloroflexota bacterium]|nr:NAD(P)/FAD-dependent oxidoreductase [Chloroflexota bacterium]